MESVQVTRPAGPLMRRAIQQEMDRFKARIGEVVTAASQELGLPPNAEFDLDSMTWHITLPSQDEALGANASPSVPHNG